MARKRKSNSRPKKKVEKKVGESEETPQWRELEVEQENFSPPPTPVRPSFLASLPAIFFGLCLFVGIACRFYGLNWDQAAHLHPDERFCTGLVPGLRLPQSLAEYFDSSRSPLNPDNQPNVHYIYGQLPLFIGKIGATIAHPPTDNDFLVVARFLSALFDTGTVFFSFLIARRLFDLKKALLAASLVSCAALHIQQSHFFVTDPFQAFFLTASFWAGTRWVQGRNIGDAGLLGIFFGAALASKISALLFAIAILGFVLLHWRRFGIRPALLGALICAVAAIAVFRLGSPMVFRGQALGGYLDLRIEPRFWNDLQGQSGITRGDVDVPFDVQWIGRTSWLFSLRNLGFWGYGWPFLLSAGAGLFLLLRKPRAQPILLVGALFALMLLGVEGAAFSKFSRYYLPLTPFCALLAAFAWQELEKKKRFLGLGAPIVAVCAVLWALAVTSIYGRPQTRLAASQWIVTHIRPGTIVANETPWDETLPISWIDTGDGGLASVYLDSYGVDTPKKREDMVRKLDAAQWIFISSGRSWQNIPRWPQKWPMMTEFYRALFDGRLGFRLEKRFDSFPELGPFQFPDANAEEALTVYDHPLVMLFHKTSDYKLTDVRTVLDNVALPEPQDWHPNQAPKPDETSLPIPPRF